MGDKLDDHLDDEIKKWIDEHRENLQSMYESYCLEWNDSEFSFDDFAVYMFYELGH